MRPCLAPAFLSLTLLAAPHPDRTVEPVSCPALALPLTLELAAELKLSPSGDLPQTVSAWTDPGVAAWID